MKIMIEEWDGDGDGAIRIPDEALHELELDVGDSLYLIEKFVGNARCLVLSTSLKSRIRYTNSRKHGIAHSLETPTKNETAAMRFLDQLS